jgi:penicillin-binding protein 1A
LVDSGVYNAFLANSFAEIYVRVTTTNPLLHLIGIVAAILFGTILAGLAIAGIIVIVIYPQLPATDSLTDYRPKVPLRIYTADNHLIGEFGEERRSLVTIAEVPPVLKQAILAAEDERFYEHNGVDTRGMLRAAYSNVAQGGKRQGASTITMQVARNFFLSTEKTLTRKLYEVLLAFKIENNLGKDEILQLYINQIYLGQRAYGFASAAQIYFGKPLKDISLEEASMLAGLPKAPSAYNPVANPRRAQLRQRYVLRRMRELDFITPEQFEQAQKAPLHVKRDGNDFGTPAEYVAEMARQLVVAQFPDDTYSHGYRVITTINRAEQLAAHDSLRRAVMEYDQRHGYRGAESYVDMTQVKGEHDEILEELLQDFDDSGDLLPAIALQVSPNEVIAYLRGGELLHINAAGLAFASRMINDKAPPNKQLRRGAVIRVHNGEKGWRILQLPEVEAAFVAASPVDGAVRALVGGWDFGRNKFNHVTQAWRQPGSSFKPFIYSAALEKGFSPASVLDDLPITISAEETGSQEWEPHNYDGKYEGSMTLRTALAKSKNMVSIRLLRAIDPHYAQDYITRFGFNADKHPPYLTMALGAGAVTPWQHLAAYSVFANGGYRVSPFIIRQVLDDKGNVIAETKPELAGDEALRVVDPRNAWLIDSMMHDVVRRGTATRAVAVLKRSDLAGKTGTTNDYIDAWFCGYQPTIVGIAWIGFDQPKRMGSGETGGGAALPIWIGFMEKALRGIPETFLEKPDGLAPVIAHGDKGKERNDFMYQEYLPEAATAENDAPPAATQVPAPVREATVQPVSPPLAPTR